MLFDISGAMMALQGWYNKPEVGPQHLYDKLPGVQQVPPASSSEEPTEDTSDVDKDELIPSSEPPSDEEQPDEEQHDEAIPAGNDFQDQDPSDTITEEFNKTYANVDMNVVFNELLAKLREYAAQPSDDDTASNNNFNILCTVLMESVQISNDVTEKVFMKGGRETSLKKTFGKDNENYGYTDGKSEIIGPFYNKEILPSLYDHIGLILSKRGLHPYFEKISDRMEILRQKDSDQFNGALFNNLLYFMTCFGYTLGEYYTYEVPPVSTPITAYDPTNYVKKLAPNSTIYTDFRVDSEPLVLTNVLTFGNREDINNVKNRTGGNRNIHIRALYEPFINVVPFSTERLLEMMKVMPDVESNTKRFYLQGAYSKKPDIQYINYGDWNVFKDQTTKMVVLTQNITNSQKADIPLKKEFAQLAYIDVERINKHRNPPFRRQVIYDVYSYAYFFHIVSRAVYFFPKHDELVVQTKKLKTNQSANPGENLNGIDETKKRKRKQTENPDEKFEEMIEDFNEKIAEKFKTLKPIIIITNKNKNDMIKYLFKNSKGHLEYTVAVADDLSGSMRKITFKKSVMNSDLIAQCNSKQEVENCLNYTVGDGTVEKMTKQGSTGPSIHFGVLKNGIILCPFEAVRDVKVGDKVDHVYVDCWFRSQMFMDRFFEHLFQGHPGKPCVYHCIPNVKYEPSHQNVKLTMFVPDTYNIDKGFTYETGVYPISPFRDPHFNDKKRHSEFVQKLVQIVEFNYNIEQVANDPTKNKTDLTSEPRTIYTKLLAQLISSHIYGSKYNPVESKLAGLNLETVILDKLKGFQDPSMKKEYITSESHTEILYTMNSLLSNKDTSVDEAAAFERAVESRYETDGMSMFDDTRKFVRSCAHSLDHERGTKPLDVDLAKINRRIFRYTQQTEPPAKQAEENMDSGLYTP